MLPTILNFYEKIFPRPKGIVNVAQRQADRSTQSSQKNFRELKNLIMNKPKAFEKSTIRPFCTFTAH